MLHKRGLLMLILCVILVFEGCMPESAITDDGKGGENNKEVFLHTVHYIDVGQGDCILLKFSDGVNVLIDCGENVNNNATKIQNYLEFQDVSKIDYFILTHPDGDHIGNAKSIINSVEIETIYFCDIPNNFLSNFVEVAEIKSLAKDKNINFKPSRTGEKIKGENYTLAFLSPEPAINKDSPYKALMINPLDEDARNNVSPMLYGDINGVRFLFTGDAGESQEAFVLSNYKTNIYSQMFYDDNINVNLENIDVLKLSHQGAEGGSSKDFLELLNPKHAVIMVGANNNYYHPSISVLYRLQEICPLHELYRTDQRGNVVVGIRQDKTYKFTTEI